MRARRPDPASKPTHATSVRRWAAPRGSCAERRPRGGDALDRSAILAVPDYVRTFDPADDVADVADVKAMPYANYIGGLHVCLVDAAVTLDLTMTIMTLVFWHQMDGKFGSGASPVEAEGELDDEASYAFGVTAWIQERLDAHIDALLAAAAPGSGEEEV